jgi:hypothetical protein
MNKQTLIEILHKGVDNKAYETQFILDKQYAWVKGEYVVCHRDWNYDDNDMNDDHGRSMAKIGLSGFEQLIEEALKNSSATMTFASINTFHSHSRYDCGASEDFDKDDYQGKVQISISISDEKIKYSFLPTPPEIPRIRLQQGKDYL